MTEAGTESWIVGGGAYHAEDKVVQHNGCGTVNVSIATIVSPSLWLIALFSFRSLTSTLRVRNLACKRVNCC